MKKNEKKKSQPRVRRQKTFELVLTKLELLHIRDMLSVLLPPHGAQTLSEAMAELESRTLVESQLWDKVSILCEAADLPVGSEAPDYVIAPTSSPTLGVFHINHDVDDEDEHPEGPAGFLPDEEQDEESEEEDSGDE